MTLKEIEARFPKWSRKTVVEAWLALLQREAGRELVEREHGVTLDESGEADLTADQAEAIYLTNTN